MAHPLWTAHDVAEACGWRSEQTARAALRRWRAAGLVDPAGTDAGTGARLYRREQVLAAHRADHADERGGAGRPQYTSA